MDDKAVWTGVAVSVALLGSGVIFMVNQSLLSGAPLALIAVAASLYFLLKIPVHQRLQRFMDESEKLLQRAQAVADLDDTEAQKVLTADFQASLPRGSTEHRSGFVPHGARWRPMVLAQN